MASKPRTGRAAALLVAGALSCASFYGGFIFHRYLENQGGGQEKAAAPHGAFRQVSIAAGKWAGVRNNFIVKAAQKASPAVVFVGVTQIKVYANPFFDDPFFRQFFPPSIREFRSMGSGVIVAKNGYVVTNFHVVENASKITVYLQNGRTYGAEVLGADPYVDLAVLKIKAANLPAVAMCPNDSLYIGEWAIAIGNPFGALIKDNRPTVTQGVISAVNRVFTRESGISNRYINMIQTDAAINPGNSGGALVNCHGELIGINTFIFTQNNSGSVGVGFAIPVSRVRRVLREVIKYGKVRSFYTGISVQDISPVMAQSMGLKAPRGVIINHIDKKSPAKKAGLKVGDVILKVDQYKVNDSDYITEIFQQYLAGDRVVFEIIRNKKKKKISLVLESRE